MKTTFDIKFIEDFASCDTITFIDQSSYNPDVEITHPTLTVTVPDLDKFIICEYIPKTTNVISKTSLKGLDVVDGLYEIELSICPNDKVKQKFYHLKICCLVRKIATSLCDDSSNENIKEKMEWFKQLQAAQLFVLCDIEKALAIFKTISGKLKSDCSC